MMTGLTFGQPVSGVVIITIVFNDIADSNQSSSLAATFRKLEGEKTFTYEKRVQEVER